MAPTDLTCRIRVEKAGGNDGDNGQPQEVATFPLGDCPDIGIEIRTRWATEVMKHFEKTRKPHTCIRPWDFVARLDGSIESLTMPVLEGDLSEGYPARFQIPPSTLYGFDHDEKVRRAEVFAMASLLYEIMSGRKPFEGLTDNEVQGRFINGEFPDDAVTLPNSLFILSGWSEEFSQELTRRVKAQDVNFFQAASEYARAHPVLTGLQVVGLTVSALSFLAVPVLGAVGFTTAGPAAGSAAAAWQASIGAVEAGSLFAWCQSAAMGGAAMGGIQATGVAAFFLSYNVSSDLRFSFQVDQQILTELEQAAERGMVFTRSQDNTPAGGVTQASDFLYPQVVVPEKKRKIGNDGGKELPAQPVAKKRRRSVKSNGDAAASSNKRKPGRPRRNGAADTKNGDAAHIIGHNESDQEPSSPGARPTSTSTSVVASDRTVDDDKETNTTEVAMSKPIQIQVSGDEVSDTHDQVKIGTKFATRKKRRKVSEGIANVDKNGADSNNIGKKPGTFIGTATKATHKRFGSEDIEVLETISSTGIEKRKERQEDVSEGETESGNEAPETVSASAGFDKARISALEAARVTARQKEEKKHKRREHDQRLKLQAKSAKDPQYNDKPSTEDRRTKASSAKNAEADGQTPVGGSKSTGNFPSIISDEGWRPPANSRTSGKTPLPLLLPEEILAAQPVVRTPTSTLPNSKVAVSQKRKFLDLESKPPKDIKRGGVTIRVLQDNRSILPPKSSQVSKTLRESWLSGRRGFKGEIAVPRRKLGGGFVRRR